MLYKLPAPPPSLRRRVSGERLILTVPRTLYFLWQAWSLAGLIPCYGSSIPTSTPQHHLPEMAPVFLDLPPEIRNLIYRYALGSSHLHVYGRRSRIRVCGNPESYRYRAGRIEMSSGRVREMCLRSSRHYCWEKRKDRRRRCKLALGLLLACRQVYCEAALLPFGLNTFVFGTYTSFANFLSSLTFTQATAVRRVVVESVAAGSFGSETMALAGELHRRWVAMP